MLVKKQTKQFLTSTYFAALCLDSPQYLLHRSPCFQDKILWRNFLNCSLCSALGFCINVCSVIQAQSPKTCATDGECLPLTAVSVKGGSCSWQVELGRAGLEESWSWAVAVLPHFWLGFCCCSSKCFIYFQTGLCEFGVSCFLSLLQIQALTPSCPLLGQCTCWFAASPLSDLGHDLCVALPLFWGIGKIAYLRRRMFFWVEKGKTLF